MIEVIQLSVVETFTGCYGMLKIILLLLGITEQLKSNLLDNQRPVYRKIKSH